MKYIPNFARALFFSGALGAVQPVSSIAWDYLDGGTYAHSGDYTIGETYEGAFGSNYMQRVDQFSYRDGSDKPITNQHVIDLMHIFGNGSWNYFNEWVKDGGTVLDEVIAKGREQLYVGPRLPEDIREHIKYFHGLKEMQIEDVSGIMVGGC